ncbi:MAG TPA: riboflavin kinase, partial [Cyclobacteriaceae bacterium]|nr:riboflavin kinase [Cyclobacteriaceae bacterium]
GTQRSIEVNIFDFDKDIYGEDITIKLMAPIRKDAHFDDLEALKKQLIVDKSSALNVLREGKWL